MEEDPKTPTASEEHGSAGETSSSVVEMWTQVVDDDATAEGCICT